jgi:predicted kinase
MKFTQYLFVLCGEAFSGKSTFSKKLAELYEAKVIGRDDIYFKLDELLALEESPADDEENLWKNLLWPVAMQGVKNQLLLGHSVVVDDNCLFLKQRKELHDIANKMGIKHVLIYFNISSEMLMKRKEKNKITKDRHDVPSSWLEEDATQFERPDEKERPIIYRENEKFEDVIIKIEKLIKT